MRSGTRNRGSVSIEISERDKSILEKFQTIVHPVNSCISSRRRITNFSKQKEHSSVTWSIFNLDFRNQLLDHGMTYGRKSNVISPPLQKYSEVDYWRGVLDGDGSLGLTATNLPFVSLVTASEKLKDAYLQFLGPKIIKNPNRNLRDNVYNIVVTKEHAQKLAAKLYYPGCLALDRKIESAEKISKWIRPIEMKFRPLKKYWSDTEDEVVLKLDCNSAATVLNRTVQSVKMRLYRLKSERI